MLPCASSQLHLLSWRFGKKQDCALFMKVIVTSGQKYMSHIVPEARDYSQDIARASDKDFNRWV